MPFTFTDGIVSAHRATKIQVTAPVHFGSSGGPLLDSSGRVVGVIVGGHVGTQFNFAIDVSQVAAMVRDAKSAQITRFPLPQLWSDEERGQVAHFVLALENSDSAWSMVNRPFDRLAPESLPKGSRMAFAKRMNRANAEAKQVPTEMLKRLHPDLPNAFKDYLAVTEGIGPDVIRGVRDPDKVARWNRWVIWMNKHRKELRFPSSAKR
jgi:hypothetical protein